MKFLQEINSSSDFKLEMNIQQGQIYSWKIIIEIFQMEAFNASTSNMKQQPKIKTLQCYTKIQEGRPAHHSNLVNKELGYDCIIDMLNNEQQIKIKNCISSARSNSQLFKRISRSLIPNIRNSIDQLYLFVSANPSTRLQTSIGLSTNPGLFLIVGLTYLDQKYKQVYQKCDVQFSFIEFRQGQMYDLLCYTGKPLTEKRECCTNKLANFGQHWARTSTFNQFIKVFKIALFNNKERDFSSGGSTQKLKSTFIMKVRNKIYNEEGEIIKESETALVDFQPNCVKQSSQGAKQKNGSKSLLDYILIECHNSNPENKNIHYHLVEQNNLLLLIKKYLYKNKDFRTSQINNDQKDLPTVGGQLTIINSFPAIKQSFNSHYSFLQQIYSYINQPFEAKVEVKFKKNIDFDYLFLHNQLKRIVKTITNNTYSSLRNFGQFKRLFVSEAKKCKATIRQLRKLINTSMKQKLELIFLKNEFLGYQMRLVGSCIKSDHFKDFYNAKSYLLLEREVGIKTQQIKEQIKLKAKDLDESETKFYLLKKRQNQKYDKFKQEEDRKKLNVVDSNLQPENTLSSFIMGKTFAALSKQPKFKPIGSSQAANINQLQLLKSLTNFLSQHMYALWDNYVLFDPRTTAQILQFQENIIKKENQLHQALENFTQSVNAIKQTDILYEQQNNLYNNNQVALFRSLNFLGVIGPQQNVKGYNVGKRIVIKGNQKQTKTKFSKMMDSQKTKLPLIKPILIKADLRISDLLIEPKESFFSTKSKSKIVEDSVQEPKNIA